MGDADAAAIRAERGDWISDHRELYLSSGGTRGHIVDVSSVGGRQLTTHCLIKYVGRKSGKTYISPLIYGNVGGAPTFVVDAIFAAEVQLNLLATSSLLQVNGSGLIDEVSIGNGIGWSAGVLSLVAGNGLPMRPAAGRRRRCAGHAEAPAA